MWLKTRAWMQLHQGARLEVLAQTPSLTAQVTAIGCKARGTAAISFFLTLLSCTRTTSRHRRCSMEHQASSSRTTSRQKKCSMEYQASSSRVTSRHKKCSMEHQANSSRVTSRHKKCSMEHQANSSRVTSRHKKCSMEYQASSSRVTSRHKKCSMEHQANSSSNGCSKRRSRHFRSFTFLPFTTKVISFKPRLLPTHHPPTAPPWC